jgi:hypothetical protein
MLDWTWNLLHLPWSVKKIHFVVLLSDFIRHAARPGLDLVQFELIFVISCFADIDLLIGWESAWSTFVVPSEEHYKATINHLINVVISILPSLDHFIFKEVFIISMDSLFRPVVPACVNPLLALRILPSSIDLGYNRFREVVGVLKMDPITSRQLA